MIVQRNQRPLQLPGQSRSQEDRIEGTIKSTKDFLQRLGLAGGGVAWTQLSDTKETLHHLIYSFILQKLTLLDTQLAR